MSPKRFLLAFSRNRLRLVRCVNGEVQVNLDCEPAFDYGRSPAHWEYDGSGYHEAVARGEAGREMDPYGKYLQV